MNESRITLALDPLGPISGGNLALNNYYARRYPATIKQSLAMIDMYPAMSGFYIFMGLAQEQQGQVAEAIKTFERLRNLPSVTYGDIAELGYAYGLAGNRQEWRKILNELASLSAKTYVSPFSFAIVYLGLGNYDETFHWLEKAYAEHSPYLAVIKAEPKFDRLRADPRFIGLLHRIGL